MNPSEIDRFSPSHLWGGGSDSVRRRALALLFVLAGFAGGHSCYDCRKNGKKKQRKKSSLNTLRINKNKVKRNGVWFVFELVRP